MNEGGDEESDSKECGVHFLRRRGRGFRRKLGGARGGKKDEDVEKKAGRRNKIKL